MAMGGFSGSDPILTVSKLKAMIKKGEVKYFYLSGMGKGGQSDVITWIKENSEEILLPNGSSLHQVLSKGHLETEHYTK